MVIVISRWKDESKEDKIEKEEYMLPFRTIKRLTFSVVVVCSMLFASAAFANAYDGGAFALDDPDGLTGGYAEITTYNNPNATTDDFSAAYVMVANDDGGGSNPYQYAQIGWMRGQITPVSTYCFFEWSNSQSSWGRVRNAYAPALGSKHGYKVEIYKDQ